MAEINRLLRTEGKTRVYEMSDGVVMERTGGSASWRNNNPGNLKFEFAGSSDKTVSTHRTRERALEAAQRSYGGVVDLDQWGNAIFETYEAGRAAKLHLLEKRHSSRTVEQMLTEYSRVDYTGQTHHQAQADYIHREAAKQGLDLHGKTIGAMTQQERNALADGIRGFEGWRVGDTRVLAAHAIQHASAAGHAVETYRKHPDTGELLSQRDNAAAVRRLQQALHTIGFHTLNGQPLPVDGHFGPDTRHAVESFQREHGLHVDGVVGKDTEAVLVAIQANPFTNRYHPHHALYEQALHQVHAEESRRHVPKGAHSDMLAGALTVDAVRHGLHRIDRVELNDKGTLVRAVQVSAIRDEPGLNRTTDPIHTRQAAQQTLQHSHEQAMQAPPAHHHLHTPLVQERADPALVQARGM